MYLSRQPDLLISKLIEKLRDANPITRRNAAGALRLQARGRCPQCRPLPRC